MWELCFNDIPKRGCGNKWRKTETMNQYKISFGSIVVPQESRPHVGQTEVMGGVKEGHEVPTSHLCGWHTSPSPVVALTVVWNCSFKLSNLQHSTMKIRWCSFWKEAQWPQRRSSAKDQFWRTQRCGLALWVALLPQQTEELWITLWVSTCFNTVENPLFPSV